MKKAIMFLCVLFSASAYAGTAYFTGNQRSVQTIDYSMGWECEYNYAGRKFKVVFKHSCPSAIEI
jgi:hypothetical protein